MKVCSLCGLEATLQDSHIIPHFVFDWIFNTSPGYLRYSDNPNLRVQDGLKLKLLCSSCEQLFSKWEKQFADHIFYPLHKSEGKSIPLKYSDWCIRYGAHIKGTLCAQIIYHFLSHGFVKKITEQKYEHWTGIKVHIQHA